VIFPPGSAQPGRILQVYDIDLARPRSIATMNQPRFSEYRAMIWDKLSREVTRAMEMQE
jgi:NitT/TauT family transport system ATP-binding protein